MSLLKYSLLAALAALLCGCPSRGRSGGRSRPTLQPLHLLADDAAAARKSGQPPRKEGYACRFQNTDSCPEPRFTFAARRSYAHQLSCTGRGVVGVFNNSERGSGFTEVRAWSGAGRPRWRFMLSRRGSEWNHAQLAITRSGAVVVAGWGRAERLLPEADGRSRPLAIGIDDGGQVIGLMRLNAPADVIGQGRPVVAVDNDDQVFIGVAETLARGGSQERWLVAYRFSLDGAQRSRVPLARMNSGDEARAMLTSPGGEVWLRDRRHLFRLGKRGTPLDRYPLWQAGNPAGMRFSEGEVTFIDSNSYRERTSDGRRGGLITREVLWQVKPRQPLVQIAERVRGPRTSSQLHLRGGRQWLTRHGPSSVTIVVPLNSAFEGDADHALWLHNVSNRLAWCPNGDLVVKAYHELVRQPLGDAAVADAVVVGG